MNFVLNEVDKVEILTLQDNYVDILSRDDTDMLIRAKPSKGLEPKHSILAEHGFSALVTVTASKNSRSLLFDFGFSEHGAAMNADNLDVNLKIVEALIISHGHPDHVGGLEQLTKKIGEKGIPLVLHPAAFRRHRYLKGPENIKVYFPSFTGEKVQATGVRLVETKEPYPLLDGNLLFIGEIPRKTGFEKGAAYLCYEEDGKEKRDPIEDDTAIVANIKGKGLFVLSGCAHSGIINTVRYAQELTGVNKIFGLMGGFHLTGPDFDPILEPTIEELKDVAPEYIVPTHCTGRKAIMKIEKEMPNQFLLNMAGTKLIFAA